MYFKYNTKQEAEEIVTSINLHLGIPKDKDSVTRTYCNIEFLNGFYCIKVDKITSAFCYGVETFDYKPPIED